MRSTTSTQTAETPTSVRPPRHVAIIMDGNNRWAKKRGLPRGAGHKAGVESVRRILEACAEQGVEVLTLFAFSSENWRRPQAEVSTLMSLLLNALKREVKRLNKNNIRLRVIGNRDRFSEAIQKHMAEAEKLTANNSQFTVVIAADYGGQWDILQATQKIAAMVVSESCSCLILILRSFSRKSPLVICQRLTFVFVPAANNVSAIFCYGRWPIPNCILPTSSGRTSARMSF